jgi:hypothetical protein
MAALSYSVRTEHQRILQRQHERGLNMRRISELLILLLCVGLTVGCGAEKGTPPSGALKYRLAVIPKGTTHEFWQSVHAGAAKAARERNDVEIIWKGPLTESDRDAQISLVEDFVTKRVNGICLAPRTRISRRLSSTVPLRTSATLSATSPPITFAVAPWPHGTWPSCSMAKAR